MLDKKTRDLTFSCMESLRKLGLILARGPLLRWRYQAFRPQKIIHHPIDLHLADPLLAQEFYHGRFALAGRVVNAGSLSPFMLVAPTREWEEALHDFSWLRHMSAAKNELANAHARSLVSDWIDMHAKPSRAIVWRGDVVARRLMNWLCHAQTLCDRADVAFESKILKSLSFQMRYLRVITPLMPKTQGRLEAAIALCLAAKALIATPTQQQAAEFNLASEIEAQMLPDGGHISRNPAVLVPLLAYFIALHHCYEESEQQPPPILTITIGRVIQMLRFFQHRDFSLANFNGVGPLLPERLTPLLNIDTTTLARPLTQAAHTGYQRLAFGATTVIVDTGCPPPLPFSAQAHAGCLSFEMSSSQNRFIVNCGIDPFLPSDVRFFGRLTAAHSTATINDTSSCRFQKDGQATSLVMEGPTKVQLRPVKQETRAGFIASHNGYLSGFNLLHQRSMTLSKDGNLCEGADRFIKLDVKNTQQGEKKREEKKANIIATLRFHLHPDVEVSHDAQDTLRLEVAGADVWLLSCEIEMQLEDSIYFCALRGSTKTRQIVVSFNIAEREEVYWAFRRLEHVSKKYQDITQFLTQ